MMKIKFILICLMFLSIVAFTSCKKEAQPEESREEIQKKEGIPVEIVAVRKGNIFVTINVNGELKADEKATVNTTNTGVIEKVLVKEGDYVKENQIIALLETGDIEDQMIQAQATLNKNLLKLTQAQSKASLQTAQVEAQIKQAEEAVRSAEAVYNQTLIGLETAKEQESIIQEGARFQEIAKAQEAVTSAEANFRQADIDLGRMQRLYEKGAIAKQKLDMAQVQYDVAKAQYNTACQTLDLVKEGARKQEKETARQQVSLAQEKVDQAYAALEQTKQSLNIALSNREQITVAREEVAVAGADVEQAKATISTLNRKLGKSYIKSPISGYVIQKYVNSGENAGGPGATKIVDIFDPRSLYFEAIVSDNDIEKIRKTMEVDIKIDGISDKKFKGTIYDIIPSATGASRQFQVKVSLNSETHGELKPGMFARGEIILSAHKNVTIVPKVTVTERKEKYYVYTVKDGKAVEKEVIPGPSTDGEIEIYQGVTEGEDIIYSGTVQNGDIIKIVGEK